MLRTADATQLAALASFQYERKRVVLHTDGSLMPPRARDWSPLNIVVAEGADAAAVTVWMNRIDASLRAELRSDIFQTWNPNVEPAKGWAAPEPHARAQRAARRLPARAAPSARAVLAAH